MAVETVIGRTIVIDGEVKSSEDISIEGTVKGKITTTADLVIQDSGVVEAEVETRSIEIHGTVIGNVHASDKYEIMKGGRVTGDVNAPRLVVADGSRFKGSIDMADEGGRSDEPAKPKAKR